MIDRRKIRTLVEANGRRFVETLKEACSHPSISAEGLGLEQMSGWLEDRLLGMGAEVSRLEVAGAPPALLGWFPGSPAAGSTASADRTLMIYDHYDVQPVDPIDLWDSPPFEPAERDGRIYARGVADNKGDLVARLCALETYRELNGDPPFNIKFLVEGEEESGSLHFEQICRAHADRLQADHCVWEGWMIDHEGRPELVYGCKGLLYVELRCRKLAYDQHSSNAVYLPSAAWHLLRAVGSIKGPDGRVAIPGFYDDALPPDPRETPLLERLPFDEEAELARLGITSFADGLTGMKLREALMYDPTANIAGFVTGYTVPGASKTVLPAEAMAKLDFRLVPDQDAGDIAHKLRRHLERSGFADVEMEVTGEENPSRSPTDSILGRAIESEAAAWFPKEPVVWPLMPATGPMFPIARLLGIPICSPPGVTRPDSAIHAPNEQIRVDDFYDVIGYTTAYLEAYGAL
jgi:acetylornithine deacetylase/succinyl-diaminopimelate desuccinylase-like protein